MAQGFCIGNLTLVTLSGADRNKIANNLCTQDLRNLAAGEVVETFVTDAKGRTLCHGLMIGLTDRMMFVSAPGQAERLVPHFDRYIIREDVSVFDASNEWEAVLFLDLPSLRRALKNVGPRDGGEREDGDAESRRAAWNVERQGVTVIALAVPWVTGGGGLVLIPKGALGDGPWQSLLDHTIPSDTQHREGWEMARIEAFWPWYSVDCDDRNLPQEIGIDNRAISFKKGCYLGQETVARLDAMGQVQKKLVQLRVEGTVPVVVPYAIELEGREVGVITSVAQVDEKNQLALAMVRRSHFAVGTEIAFDRHRAVVVGPLAGT
jgi:folate-binding protein YgfZ